MDIQKLKQVVTAQAQREASTLIETAKIEYEEKLKTFLQESEEQFAEQKQNLFETNKATLNHIRFSAESEYKKKVLHTQHDLFLQMQDRLVEQYFTLLKTNPGLLLHPCRPQVPSEAHVYVSPELGEIITESVLRQQGYSSPAYLYQGVDESLELGICFQHERVKYIFLIQEIIQDFIQKNRAVYGKKLLDES